MSLGGILVTCHILRSALDFRNASLAKNAGETSGYSCCQNAICTLARQGTLESNLKLGQEPFYILLRANYVSLQNEARMGKHAHKQCNPAIFLYAEGVYYIQR